jgi:predicted RNA-binding protein with PUA-like domain
MRLTVHDGHLIRPLAGTPTVTRYWLMKSEPDEASVDDFAKAPGRTLPWTGVRNYQARNFMRDEMRVGDGVLFYHSSCAEPGIVGLARIAARAEPDATQFDPKNPYYDAKSTPAAPRWLQIDVQLTDKTGLLSLAQMRSAPELSSMRVLQRGNRLSITPVSDEEWHAVLARLRAPPPPG